jgi:hypothetical protein
LCSQKYKKYKIKDFCTLFLVYSQPSLANQLTKLIKPQGKGDLKKYLKISQVMDGKKRMMDELTTINITHVKNHK